MPFHVDSNHGPSAQGAPPKGAFATGTLKTDSTSLKEVVLLQVLSLLVFTIPLQFAEPTDTVLIPAAAGGPAGTIVWLEYGIGLTSVGRIFSANIPLSHCW